VGGVEEDDGAVDGHGRGLGRRLIR
jgi:hypothetical protein